MNIRRIVFTIVIVVLALSVTFGWYYLNLRAQNQNTLNNMRARSLAAYGSEMVTISFFLEKYLETLDLDIIHQEVRWSIPRAIWEADSCVQGLDPDSGLIYYELKGAALALRFFFVDNNGYENTSKVQSIIQLLTSIGEPFSGLDILENEDPLQHLMGSDVGTIVNLCEQLIEVTGYGYSP